jgi:prepilin-type N-terminal cleavage/methylation domain-containing protein/prepilin-type processing-associated H-X9-DG protein
MILRARGFTLIELLVVITVIAILAAITVPVSSRVIQSGRAAGCIANLSSLGTALNLYLADHNGIMPPLAAGRQSVTENIPVIDNTLNAYLSDLRVFLCPADNLGIGTASGTSYYWNSVLSNQHVADLQFFNSGTSEIPVIADKQGFHPYTANKVNILYADGHASQNLKFGTSQ